MRSSKLLAEEDIEGGEAEADAWKRLWNAIIARAVRGFLLSQPNDVPPVPTRSKKSNALAYTSESACTDMFVWIGTAECGIGGVESDIFELPYTKTGSGRLCCWNIECYFVVLDNHGCEADWVVELVPGSIPHEAVQDTGSGG